MDQYKQAVCGAEMSEHSYYAAKEQYEKLAKEPASARLVGPQKLARDQAMRRQFIEAVEAVQRAYDIRAWAMMRYSS